MKTPAGTGLWSGQVLEGEHEEPPKGEETVLNPIPTSPSCPGTEGCQEHPPLAAGPQGLPWDRELGPVGCKTTETDLSLTLLPQAKLCPDQRGGSSFVARWVVRYCG